MDSAWGGECFHIIKDACFIISLLWSKGLRSGLIAAPIFFNALSHRSGEEDQSAHRNRRELAFVSGLNADLLRQHFHHQQRIEIIRPSFAGAGRGVEDDRRR